MGAICSSSGPIRVSDQKDDEIVPQHLPLAALKQELLESLNMTDDHPAAPFVTYRFFNAFRLSKEVVFNIQRGRQQQLRQIYRKAREVFHGHAYFKMEKQVLALPVSHWMPKSDESGDDENEKMDQ